MVFVIVEICQDDVGEIVKRLLGTRHKITVVEELQTACGCTDSPPVSKRPRVEPTPGPVVTHSTPYPEHEPPLLYEPELSEVKVEHLAGHNEPNVLSAMDSLASHPSVPDQSSAYLLPSPPTRRNNGVPYNSGVLYPSSNQKSEGIEEEEPKEEFPEGADLAIKCVLCGKTIALGCRPANHSTRKYAHARCHGFKNRFECNLCQAVFKNKRVTLNHNKSVHNNDPSFQVIDTWNETSQRELMQMVRKCFPKTNRPFLRSAGEPSDEVEDGGDE